MKRKTQYRLYLNNEPATQEQLDRIESITVEQEVDIAWEVRLVMPLCLDRRGRWLGADEAFRRPAARVRVEVSVRDNRFVPLIDGPIVGWESQMQFEPGQSTVTVIVQDDSVFLNKNDQHFSFDEESDREIIAEIFESTENIARSDLDDDLAEGEGESPSFRGTGTAMQILRCLAKVYDKHVYVLPGENPGESIGNFKAFPGPHDREADSLPPLILLGSEANARSLPVRRDLTRPAEAFAATVQAADKSVLSSTTSYQDHELLGDRGALPEREEPARRLLRPGPCVGRRLERAVAGRAHRSSYAFGARGEVIGGCYFGVLQPYRLVTVQAGETPQSGTYVITQVTHTLTRSAYGQSFTLISNSESDISGESQVDMARSIF